MPAARGRLRAVLRAPRALLGPDATGAVHSLVALVVSSATATVAGVVLAAMTDTLADVPGLLVLVPAAIGMRGNIFGALGSRLATAIHTGSFVISRRVDTVVGQNVVAALVLSAVTALVLAVLAKIVAAALGLGATAALLDLVAVSALGAFLASLVVLVVTLALAAGSTTRGWDLDSVNAPLVSAVGDMVTLPALLVASLIVGHTVTTWVVAALAVAGTTLGLVFAFRAGLGLLATVLRESLPVLVIAGFVLTVAGVVIEHRFDDFLSSPALLILVPSALSGAGAIGGILVSQLSSKLHLGVVEPRPLPDRDARSDIVTAVVLAVPVFLLSGALAQLAAELTNKGGPGWVAMMSISLAGGLATTVVVVAIAYYGSVAAVRLGVDPDTYGIPIVTSAVDLIGAWCLVTAISVWA